MTTGILARVAPVGHTPTPVHENVVFLQSLLYHALLVPGHVSGVLYSPVYIYVMQQYSHVSVSLFCFLFCFLLYLLCYCTLYSYLVINFSRAIFLWRSEGPRSLLQRQQLFKQQLFKQPTKSFLYETTPIPSMG